MLIICYDDVELLTEGLVFDFRFWVLILLRFLIWIDLLWNFDCWLLLVVAFVNYFDLVFVIDVYLNYLGLIVLLFPGIWFVCNVNAFVGVA